MIQHNQVEVGQVSSGNPGQHSDGIKIFCFKESRVVAADNTIRYGPRRLQLLPSPERASYARATVEVHERPGGDLAVYLDGREVKTRPAPPEPALLRLAPHQPKERAEGAGKRAGNPAWGRNFKFGRALQAAT